MSSIPYSHVLQKSGLLKSFTVARVLRGKELQTIKKRVKADTATPKEFEAAMQEELRRMSAVFNKKNPVPGIIFPLEDHRLTLEILKSAQKTAKSVQKSSMSVEQTTLFVVWLIKELNLTPDNFSAIDADAILHSIQRGQVTEIDDDDDEDEAEV